MTTCKAAATSRRLDEALDQGFPASDPASLTEPAGDARDADGCCCSGATDKHRLRSEAAALQTAGCCGSAKAAG